MNATQTASPSLGTWKDDNQIHFRVWAPTTQTIEVIPEKSHTSVPPFALSKDTEGFFTGVSGTLSVGDLYRYRVDGKGPYPDPASRFQPQGVHGPSMVIDASMFQWADSNWRGCALERLSIYELHIGTFTPSGTFRAVIEKLSVLKDLGITAIELMPVADFPGRWNWGYDGVDLFAPSHSYGTPDDLRSLVNAAHQQGLAVIMDVVYNHLGPDGNYLSVYSPYYFTDRHKSPWGAGVNLDGEHSPSVRAYFMENAMHWISEYHMDGLRLDATHALMDESPTHFLAELSERVHSFFSERPVHLFAEDHRHLKTIITPVHKKGWGMDGVWADDFHHIFRRFLAGDHEAYFAPYQGTTDEMADVIQKGWLEKKSAELPLSRYLFCLQNHDQVGNRACGERLHHQIDLASYRAASAVFLFTPETPLLFMGQEWATSSPFLFFTDHHTELGRLITQGRREEFKTFSNFADPALREKIPDPQAASTFEKSRLRWDELERIPHQGLWRLYQALLRLRQIKETFGSSVTIQTQVLNASTLAIHRRGDTKEWVLIACLKGSTSVPLPSRRIGENDFVEKTFVTTEDPLFTEQEDSLPIIHDAGHVHFQRPGAIILQWTHSF